MSVHVSSPVWLMQSLSPTEKLVLLKLADHAGDDGCHSFPGITRMVRECCVSRSTVQRILKRFVSRGLLIVEAYEKGGRGHATSYRIDLERVSHADTLSVKGVIDERVSPETVKGVTDDDKGCHNYDTPTSLTKLNQRCS